MGERLPGRTTLRRRALCMGAGGLVVLAVAGCGGTSAQPATTARASTTTAAPADPGRDAIEAFAAAARRGRAASLWRMLSTSSRERLGPTLRAFRRDSLTELRRGVGSLERFRVIVSERITPELGVVAIDGWRRDGRSSRRAVYAAVLRLERSSWKVELGGPVTIRPIGPDPGARERVAAQVAAAVRGPGGAGTAVMYVDGQTVSPTVAGTASDSTLYANFDPGLDRGRHTVVVFATDGREASATAWAFTVAKGG
ncbi:MAG TPA: hypothetical protein VFA66_12435 [Gaiellaceae bacterium]|nr:hypothetical protein [Gaiellaceae bacterium]